MSDSDDSTAPRPKKRFDERGEEALAVLLDKKDAKNTKLATNTVRQGPSNASGPSLVSAVHLQRLRICP